MQTRGPPVGQSVLPARSALGSPGTVDPTARKICFAGWYGPEQAWAESRKTRHSHRRLRKAEAKSIEMHSRGMVVYRLKEEKF